MKKTLLLTLVSFLLCTQSYSQVERLWTPTANKNVIASKNVERPSFPAEFQLYELNIASMKQLLVNAPDRAIAKKGVIISLPNMQGIIEQFEVFEASNFAADLQAQFPEIRSYAGKSLQDRTAILRMSVSPQGIQTMVFRTDTRNEFMEPYSEDGKIYAVYNSSRSKGKLPFTCMTEDKAIAESLNNQVTGKRSSASELLTFRLALSCTGEYGAYFGGAAGALAQMNATMTRVNGVFEKDFTIRMTMVNNAAVIYTVAASDPYSPAAQMANWNAELQTTLTAQIGEANYDIGHLFGASGGGGNAGCIGCVCTDGTKGSGITSPGSGAAMGDTFDIDYVAHEMGHQFGGNHTFSHAVESAGVNVEPGSGSTIMGYAGITNYDVQMNSDAYFHYATISQVEDNMLSKTCPTRTPIANIAPVVDAGLNYTIPKSTPFVLTASGTDVNGDALTYCWEQIDSATTQTNANSAASASKTAGPNWRSYSPTASPSRYFPALASVIANSAFTTAVSTDTTPIKTEYLSSVARSLNFAVTARDNVAGAGLTDTDGMSVTVNATAGPFAVTSPTTAVSWAVGTNQSVTWSVAGTTANGVNAAFVDIYLSNDGGNTYPTLLASRVPNDGTETVTIPNAVGTTKRIMVKGNNHIFFDISNANFSITAPTSGFAVSFDGTTTGQNKQACQGTNVAFSIPYTTYGGFSGTTSFSAAGLPVGAIATFSPATISANGVVTMTISNTNGAAPGVYSIVVTATSGTTKTVPFYLDLLSSNFGVQALTGPADLSTGVSTTAVLTWPANAAATSYDVQVATDSGFTTIVNTGTATTNSYNASGLAEGTLYYWRVLPKNTGCAGTYSAAYRFTTGTSACNVYSNNTTVAIADGTGANVAGAVASKTIVVPAGGNLNDVNVSLSFTHTYIEDLVIWLVHPDGTQVSLWNRNCDNEFSTVNVTFSDGNASVPDTGCTISTGTFSPDSPLSALNGKASAGTWTLRATDNYNGDTGSLLNWSLDICAAQPLGVIQNSLSNFAIYPNPNKGNFTVQFNSDSGNDVAVSVHDISGRKIFDKKYSNNGLFSQNLQLNHVQTGVYLVTVQDGDNKIVKRIVVE
ncbi:reprolysin-like metallopeptidase [Flavobacterium sp. GT3R68]|uniref:zinc-dependent metalloprotease n=1 Tax=Flavobacterium sp. GT3R68 TaxID=2594437 RepID=UPI000F87E3C6|nr:zinc-dependent metalloprotease family protein [Flavobacterium sp. GT3R68]RTY90879.1 T9SS type A sorting domain-containing protein [Flavobacterium sp. GSN2]TRW93871.1 T9SS type A sorting domain-containing protein [Flavobacterium sp. GT3R68]